MKTYTTSSNSLRTNLPNVHEEQPGPAENHATTSTRGNPPPLGRPPSKRRRLESDEPGASMRRTERLLVNERTGASESAWDRRVGQSVTRSHLPDDPADRHGIAPDQRLDRVPADVSGASSHRRPQRSTHDRLEASTYLRPSEQPSDRIAGKRPREEQEPYRQSKRQVNDVGLTKDDLRRAEHQLDSAAKKRLQAQREQQRLHLSEPHGIARNHNAGLCVSMAYDNELAHRMRDGMALPFLEEGVNAQINAQRLDKYLSLIASARRARTGVTPRDLDRCTELAAHYLYQTGWFEGASLAQLAHVSNKLSKHPNQPACMEAIAWIAGQVNQADDLVGLSGYLSALLLNAFAKNTDSGRCERAVARLARHLLRDKQVQQSLIPWEVGLALNTFSKWFDNPDCQATAHRLAALVASDKRLGYAMDAQSVANTLNALCKWPDNTACAAAASALAARLADEGKLRKDLKPQELSNALNALSKWPDTPVCGEAIGALAARLADESTLRKGLCPQEMGNALNALSKWPDMPACADAVGALAERLADESTLRKDLKPQELSNALNALSKWPDTPVCGEAVSALAARLADERKLRNDLSSQGVANALNALSKWPDMSACAAAVGALADDPGLGKIQNSIHVIQALNALSKWPDMPVCGEAIGALAARLADESALRKDLDAQGVANVLNALSKWSDTPVCGEAVSALAARLADESRLRNDLSSQGVAIALNALSKWPDTPVCGEAVSALAARLADEGTLRNELDPQGVANVLNALSKWPDMPACAATVGALAERLADESTLRKDLTPQEVSNALNALSKWPDTPVCGEAIGALAARLADESTLRKDLDPQGVANVLNAMSKWPDTADCAAAASALAGRLCDDPRLRKALEPQDAATALNALSKWPDTPVCGVAVGALAERLADESRLRNDLTPQGVVNVVNALSKWPDMPACAAAVGALAGRVADESTLRKDLNPRGVANVLNALSKWPGTPDCKNAANALAERLADESTLRKDLTPRSVGNVLNALSKWPDMPTGATAVGALAERLADESTLRKDLDQWGVANVLNALSKWPEMPVSGAAVGALAERLADESTLRKGLTPQGVANVLNALSKWPDTADCAAAASALAGRLCDDPGLCKALEPQHVATALNALSKWPDTPVCGAAVGALAERLADESTLRKDLDPQGVSSTLSALSRWPDMPACEGAMDLLATRLVEDHDLRHVMEAQDVAVALNAMSRCSGMPARQSAGVLLSERAGSAELPWQQFSMRGMSMMANAMSRLLHMDEEDDGPFQALGVAKLQAMAGHLDLHRERFASASAADIGVLLKALASARLQRQMRPLGQPALEQVSALVRDDGLSQTSLEGIGSLCMGLLPFIFSPELSSRHRGQALHVFNRLQPIVARKIDLYLSGGGPQPSADTERYATRRPALTFFQVLKAYAVVSRQWKPRNLEGSRGELRQRRDQLAQWVDLTLERTRKAIEADLGEMSWNLIAQIEAGDKVFDALDLRMAKDAPTITQAHPPTRFDLGSGHLSMCSVPGQPVVPATGRGSTTHVVVDLQGKEISNNQTESDKPYSLFARLTGLPLVEVQLPGEISTFMLARTFNYNGEPWRFDMFGGSRAARSKSGSSSLVPSRGPEKASLLPAFRYADTAPGSSLMQLAAKLAPQREDWSRMQRSLLEMVPSDHVVEGTLRLGVFDDVDGPVHPFKPLTVDGTALALCPNDGCGFLKLEVALSIPAFRKHYEAWQAVQANQASQEQRDLVAKHRGPSLMPAQALQHYPRDEAALEEAHEAMQRQLEALQPVQGEPLALYRLAVGGGYQGQRVRAVPSADDKVHLPQQRSQAFDVAGGPLLLGKPPYDKENLLPVPEDRIATVAKGDATAEFLSQSFGIQYSYTGFDDRSGLDLQMLHSKGMLVVVPEKNWPVDFADTDLVCSKEDLKTLSCWTNGRDRSALPRDMLSTGSLRLKEIVEPGRLGALPIAELRKRNMDTDGDDAFVYAGYPKLAALISRVMVDREGRRGRQQSFKPPKTATPAIDPASGQYQPGRLSEIMSLKRGQQVTSAAATLAARFMAQPDDLREALARQMMFGTYDGIERDLRNGLREVLEEQALDPQVLANLRFQAREAIERAHLPEAREAAELLHAQLLGLAPDAPATSEAPVLPEVLAEAFPGLAKAYEAASGVEARIHAILDNYPVLQLSHAQFPDGQPGFIPDEPELTMRNLFTIAIKVGTDALKSDTGTALFSKIVQACERCERGFDDRVRFVPYSKATARAMQEGRFDPEQTKGVLQRMPSMAAGVMEDALHALQQAGLIDLPQPPAARLRAVQPEDIAFEAQALLTRARQMEPQVTDMLRHIAERHGGQLAGTQHQLKSFGSLKEKLTQRIAVKKQTLEEAVAGVNDALRYSVVLEPQDFTAGLRAVLAALDNQGHARIKLTNQFTKYPPIFKAINVTLRNPEGALWEIQFHTPETFELKEQFHDLYKRSHALALGGASRSEQRELQAPAVEAFKRVASPPECEQIDDWQEEIAPALASTASMLDSKQNPVSADVSPAYTVFNIAAGKQGVLTPVFNKLADNLGLQLWGNVRYNAAEDRIEQERQAPFQKSVASIKDKIRRHLRGGMTGAQAGQSVGDALRYVFEVPSEDFVAKVLAADDALQRQGMTCVTLKNYFVSGDGTYRGINASFTDAEGYAFEVQFHTAESFKVKAQTHLLYKRMQLAQTRLDREKEKSQPDPVRQAKLTQEIAGHRKAMHEMTANVRKPVGVERIGGRA
ncbi:MULTISPECIES: XopAD/skwp family type III secretion system effector [Xanthomonas]|uniref:Type III effector protein XopAD n=1 Tax=Xanthomonas cucurbitae TaxID=56453 RepID=A0ABY7YB75_9XANT|nr:XopAD/skwp family type III secretion system effector [Xanthomonas cucurbitae]WDM67251.1 hypothetical protein K6981_17520 [Xanthomonas cucurbitae]WDM71129.1 hypothetical protein K6978_17485 [Xanthomonas cucurbitae]WDM74962.1 hypothetical protein K6982_16635 [Xanthomonas cucurbitae]